MNISYVNFTIASDVIAYDYFWCSVKTYVEDNYRGNEKISWSYPLSDSDVDTVDELIQTILNQNPDILMFSMYVWNYALQHDIAQQIRKLKPEITIIAGGPHLEYNQPDFWLKHYYIDFICESDGYGEVFTNEFLYQFNNGKDWSQVPYLRSKFFKSPAIYNKRTFEYPKRIYHRNDDYLTSRRELADKKNTKLYFVYESSRGCPFGCTYCEWGGGINSKVTFKPTEDCIEDFKLIFDKYKPEIFGLTDANFGINNRDIELAEIIVDLKRKTGYPDKMYLFGPTKTKKKNLYKIEEMFAAEHMISDHKVSIQDFNSDVNINIDRTDAPWEEQLEAYRAMRDKYGYRIRLELILGLPGATLDSYYQALDVMGKDSVFSKRYYWLLLPTAPAADPEYMKKFNIKTIKLKYGIKASFGLQNILTVGEEELDTKSILLRPEYTEPTDVVVETSTYTREEWFEMYMMDQIISALEVEEYIDSITKYLNTEFGIAYSDFYRELWKEINNGLFDGLQNEMMVDYINEGIEKVNGRGEVSLDHFTNKFFNVYGRLETMMNIMININRSKFYERIGMFIQKTFVEDERVEDLIRWSANMIMFLDYEPGKTSFTSKYNWWKYFQTGELEGGGFVNKPMDTLYSSDNKPIDWIQYEMEERVKKYFLVLCSSVNYPKKFKHMEISHAS